MKDTTFIGRNTELTQLNDVLKQKKASLIVVRGRRRIGKSRLIEEFAKGHTFYQFAGLAPNKGMTAQDQRNEFALQLSQQTGLPEIKADDWSKLFLLLSHKVKEGRVIILFDEITWMAQDDPTFLSKLKNIWDLYFKKNTKLILVLCGSISAWLEKNILNSTAFLGRISLDLVLQELPLIFCNQLLEALGFHRSPKEKMIYLSLTGCIPWYIEQINPNYSAEDNIKKLCFEPNALMVKEFNRVFHDLFGQRGEMYQRITKLLVMSPLDYKTLALKLNYAKSSALTDYLDELDSANYVKKTFIWDIKTGENSKLAKYRLIDNYLRFYFRCILPNLHKINKKQYTQVTVSQLPGWKTIQGLQFENLVLNNRDLVIKELNINPADIIMDDPYFQTKTARQSGCQIDYLIQTKLKTLFMCEIKCRDSLSMSATINESKAKINKLSIPRGFAVLPVLIVFNDTDEDLDDNDYFYKIIDFSKYFSN